MHDAGRPAPSTPGLPPPPAAPLLPTATLMLSLLPPCCPTAAAHPAATVMLLMLLPKARHPAPFSPHTHTPVVERQCIDHVGKPLISQVLG